MYATEPAQHEVNFNPVQCLPVREEEHLFDGISRGAVGRGRARENLDNSRLFSDFSFVKLILLLSASALRHECLGIVFEVIRTNFILVRFGMVEDLGSRPVSVFPVRFEPEESVSPLVLTVRFAGHHESGFSISGCPECNKLP